MAACDATARVAELHARDPGNAAPWLMLLKNSSNGPETSAQQAALRAMAQSERFDLYWTTLIAHLTRALLAVEPAPRGAAALTTIIGIEAAWLPPLRPLTDACKGAALEQPDRSVDCRALSAVMRRGDTYLVAGLGSSLAQRLWPADSSEYADAVEGQRIARYQIEASSRVLNDDLQHEASARHYVALLGTQSSEQAVTLAVLQEMHRDPMPPAGWRAEQPG